MLAASGFTFLVNEDGTQIWKREEAGSEMTLFIDRAEVKLTYCDERPNSWVSLMALSMVSVDYQADDRALAYAWPSFMNTQAMHIMLACRVADEFMQSQRLAA